MAKKKEIVDISKDAKKETKNYGKDKKGKIIELENKGEPKERAKNKTQYAQRDAEQKALSIHHRNTQLRPMAHLSPAFPLACRIL